MRSLNRDNYNEIMFELREDLVSSDERSSLLAQIEADPFFAEQWKLWQEAQLDEVPALGNANDEFLESLMIKPQRKAFPINYKWLAAACILLLFSISILILRQDETKVLSSTSPDKTEKADPSKQKPAYKRKGIEDQPTIAAQKHDETKEITDQSNVLRKAEVQIKDQIHTNTIQPKDSILKVEQETPHLAVTKDSVTESKAIVRAEVKSNPAEKNSDRGKKPSLASLLTNTRIKFKKQKNSPAITVKGEEGSVIISLHKEK